MNIKNKIKTIFRQVRDAKLDQEGALKKLRILKVKFDLMHDWLIEVLTEEFVSSDTKEILLDIAERLMVETLEKRVAKIRTNKLPENDHQGRK